MPVVGVSPAQRQKHMENTRIIGAVVINSIAYRENHQTPTGWPETGNSTQQ